MTIDQANQAWESALAADVDALERAGIEEVLTAIRLARARLDAVELRASRRLRYLAEQGRSEAAQRAIADATGRSQRDSSDVTSRGELCDEHPELEDALESGALAAGHLDAIQAAARRLTAEVRDEFLAHTDELMERAQHISLDAFQRECRDLAKHCVAQSRRDADVDELEQQRSASRVSRWVDRSTGMHHTMLELDPVRDAKLNAAINRELARIRAVHPTADQPWQQLMVEATLNAITGDTPAASAATGTGRTVVDRVPEITAVFQYDMLMSEVAVAGLCETENGEPLPAATLRRLCCDAEIIPVVMNGASTVLDEGRSKRTATRDQRRALRALYRGCAHPDCHVGFDACRIHHIEHWLAHRGPTDLINLLPLCEEHHHLVHEGGWGLTLDSDRCATWTRPDGVVHHDGVAPNRTPSATTSGSPTRSGTRQERTGQLTMV